ncbi:Fic family protein [uncultured Bacteroides sp.]|uniref:Fic family protein n=1 Tax=uncultured Bacteroides sp. TaxID=162156 RepID=UPI0025FC17B1|nr:Fic family protein [uncultured Bacteroides sp.]
MDIDFESYIRGSEPDKKEKASAWKTAIGLQAVDGLQTSDYLKDMAVKHIEGNISIDEVKKLINGYYQSKTVRTPKDEETEEADKVSANIARILNEQSFAFSVAGFTSIHRRLFEGIFKFAGKIRNYDITKKEWVLRGDTVLYVNSEDLRRALEYDLEQEKDFSYKGLSMDDVASHIAKFVSGIWLIHPFGEGNTRSTAVFTIKYLHSIGFDVNNDLFADNSWYFRNALVRANYRNVRKKIEPDMSFLILFFRNLMMGGENGAFPPTLHGLIHPLLDSKGYKTAIKNGSYPFIFAKIAENCLKKTEHSRSLVSKMGVLVQKMRPKRSISVHSQD